MGFKPPATAQSGSAPDGAGYVYVQESEPSRGALPWFWLRPSTGDIVCYEPTESIPSFTVDPVVSGTALVGSPLTCSPGTPGGSPDPTLTYQWKRDGSDLSGATNSTYTLVSGDVGHAITCLVTATNDSGSDTALSNAITPATPVNTVAPAVTGSAVTGQTLTCSTGTWTSAATPTYTYQWKRAGSNISAATNSTYVLQGADEGVAVKCTVTATNANGAGTPADSNTVTPSASATAPGQVTGLTLTPGSAQIAATWTAPASNGGSAITDYKVEIRNPGGSGSYTIFADGTSTTPSATITGLSNGTSVDVRVSAVNAIGAGTPSTVQSATPTSGVQDRAATYGSDLVEWMRASDLAGSDGDLIASATDNTGHGNHLVQSTTGRKPVLKLAVLNGKSVLRFDAVDDGIGVTFGSPIPQPWAVILTFKTAALIPSGKYLWSQGSGQPDCVLGLEGDSTMSVTLRAGGTQIVGHTSAPLSFHTWTFIGDGADSDILLDGESVTLDVGNGTNALTGIWLNTAADGTFAGGGDFAEVAVVKRHPTVDDLDADVAYDAAEYGL